MKELECAVSVEEDNRQEWTFTLYDFDNNGKVTREVRGAHFCRPPPKPSNGLLEKKGDISVMNSE